MLSRNRQVTRTKVKKKKSVNMNAKLTLGLFVHMCAFILLIVGFATRKTVFYVFFGILLFFGLVLCFLSWLDGIQSPTRGPEYERYW